MHTDIDQLF